MLLARQTTTTTSSATGWFIAVFTPREPKPNLTLFPLSWGVKTCAKRTHSLRMQRMFGIGSATQNVRVCLSETVSRCRLVAELAFLPLFLPVFFLSLARLSCSLLNTHHHQQQHKSFTKDV